MDESADVEGNFNMLLGDDMVCGSVREEVEECSEVAQSVQSTSFNDDIPEEHCNEEENVTNEAANDVDGVPNGKTEVGDERIEKVEPDHPVDGIPSQNDEIVENLHLQSSVEKIPSESEKLDETNPDLNLSNFGTPIEKVDGKYLCSSC